MPLESAYIVIQGPEHNGTRLALREGITSFGRLPSNDVILLGDLVSRHHARIVFFDGKASLQDLGSHNGSWVNGEKVGTRALAPGDVMRVGNFRISLHAGAPGDPFADEATGEGQDLEDAIAEAKGTRRPGSVRAHESAGDTNEIVRGSKARANTEGPAPVLTDAPKARARGDTALPDDVSVRDPAESALVRQVERAAKEGPAGSEVVAIVFGVTEALLEADDATGFLARVLELVLTRIPAHGAIFRLVPAEPEPVRVAESPAGAVRVSSSVLRWTVERNMTAYSRNVSLDQRFRAGSSVAELAGQALVSVPISTGEQPLGAVYLVRPKETGFTDAEVEGLEAIARIAAVGLDRLELRQQAMEDRFAREAMARFHTPDVVDRILSEAKKGPSPGLDVRPATVLFLDIPGFSELVDELETHDVSDILNDYIETMSAIVFAQRGTIRSLASEGILAIFGAPFSYGNDAARALRAALEMRGAFERLARDHPSLGDLRPRVALASGEVLSGTMGSPRRLDFAVVGGAVKLGSRILMAAKPGTIVVDEPTYRPGAAAFTFRKVGKQPTQVPLYELIGRAPTQRSASRLGPDEVPG
ncbi:MAG: FHA domain-containing protein [Deltaproteobacteria bacterium]|nr:FHA domain-containing protein [Deltaproteobacteria bacterium]